MRAATWTVTEDISVVDDALLHMSRTAGLTAYVLLWLNICFGLGLRASLPLPFLKRWRVADLHQFMAMLSIGVLGVHIVVHVGLKEQPFSPAEILVPLVRSVPATLGIGALYLSLLVIATSYFRRHLPLPVWRTVHGLSLVAYVLALWHAVMAGPDGNALWTQVMYWSTNAALVGLLIRRVWRQERRNAGASTTRAQPYLNT